MTQKSSSKSQASRKPVKKRRYRYTARTADRHALYQQSVQDPDGEVALLSRIFKRIKGRHALSLREDFCGTALMCAHWVKSRKGRTAVGTDLDPSVMQWGVDHHLSAMDEPGQRVTLREANVLDPMKGRFDITVAFNFSYWCFKSRPVMLQYFKGVRRNLKPDGIFFLDVYGGPGGQDQLVEKRAEGGFTYVWDQHSFNPIDNSVVNYIHFEFPDGSRMRKAFTYEWRFWNMVELRELLLEAGFSKITVYWEGTDSDGEASGTFHPRQKVEQDTAWVCYLAVER